MYRPDRVASIAGKPAPTGDPSPTKSAPCRPLCGSGLARDGIPAVHQPHRVAWIASKPAPTGDASPTESAPCQAPLWERACPRWQRCGASARPRRLDRRQASSHR
ncbi:hypothetical protein C7A07_06220 [Pseudomonas fragi]|nr:hypothetical protein C7A07_06220 [Pseudomonas fragi]